MGNSKNAYRMWDILNLLIMKYLRVLGDTTLPDLGDIYRFHLGDNRGKLKNVWRHMENYDPYHTKFSCLSLKSQTCSLNQRKYS